VSLAREFIVIVNLKYSIIIIFNNNLRKTRSMSNENSEAVKSKDHHEGGGSSKQKSTRWWRSIPTWLIVLTLVLVFPLGLLLIWQQERWAKPRKTLLTGISSGLAVMWLAFLVAIAPPSVTVTSSLAPVKSDAYRITGTVYPYDALVTVNGQKASVSGDSFQIDVPLKEGDNELTIVTVKDDKRSETKIRIHRYTKSELAAQEKAEADKKAAKARADAAASKKKADEAAVAKAKQEKAEADRAAREVQKKTEAEAAAKAKADAAAAAKAAASVTVSQKNALGKAKSYLSYSAFSRDGLVAQLEYEQFSHSDAVYGADNSGANWNEQAAKKAKSYMSYSSFSRGGLIDQLIYEKFTPDQAAYGANAVGL
jgi:hypothetical protein